MNNTEDSRGAFLDRQKYVKVCQRCKDMDEYTGLLEEALHIAKIIFSKSRMGIKDTIDYAEFEHCNSLISKYILQNPESFS